MPKGSPAIAVLTFANRGRRTVGVTVANQPFGDALVRTVIPRLRRGERGLRTYRLPTRQRGIFDVGPVEVTRRDSFELFRTSRRYGDIERIWVYPRVLGFARCRPGRPATSRARRRTPRRRATSPSTGCATTSSATTCGWCTGARRRAPGSWSSSTTSTPRSRTPWCCSTSGPARYTAESFESAVDVAASVLVASSANKAPVELRLTDGTVIGGPRLRDVTPLIDHLTGVQPTPTATCSTQLLALRRARGGTSLVVVTGVLDRDDLPYVAALRRRFDRLVVVSIDTEHDRQPPVAVPGRARSSSPRDADEACAAWNVSQVLT